MRSTPISGTKYQKACADAQAFFAFSTGFMTFGSSGFAGNAMPFGVEKQLQSAGNPELGVNRIEMIAQGVFTDVQPLGDDLAGRRGILGYFDHRLDFALGQAGDF